MDADALSQMHGYFVTFNCGRSLIDVDYFAQHLFHDQPSAAPSPHLIVFSLQEVAPLAHSFLGNTFLLPYFSRFVRAVHQASPDDYRHIVTRNVGMTSIMILARSDVASAFKVAQFAGVGVGHAEMGNKGAVGVRLAVLPSPTASPIFLTLVAAHLAPMEDAWQRRNEDWRNIVRGLAFTAPDRTARASSSRHEPETEPLLAPPDVSSTSKPSGMFDSHGLVLFGGDLNYRTSDVGPTQTQHHQFPSPKEYSIDSHGEAHESGYFAALKKTDQLKREKDAGYTLHCLHELPVTFPPTYKYSEKGGLDWPSDGSEPEKWLWSKHRFPSWCDRILFSSGLVASPRSGFRGRSYKALPLQPTSDHRPVALLFEVDYQALSGDDSMMSSAAAPFPLNPDWRQQRAAARRLEIAVGSAAYLCTQWEGNALLFALLMGAVGGYYIIQSMVGS